MGYLHLTPAYGRDYSSRKALLADFDANKDFVISEGPRQTYVNKEQLAPGTKIFFRFGRNLKSSCHIIKRPARQPEGERIQQTIDDRRTAMQKDVAAWALRNEREAR